VAFIIDATSRGAKTTATNLLSSCRDVREVPPPILPRPHLKTWIGTEQPRYGAQSDRRRRWIRHEEKGEPRKGKRLVVASAVGVGGGGGGTSRDR